jgi:hypothetical protein
VSADHCDYATHEAAGHGCRNADFELAAHAVAAYTSKPTTSPTTARAAAEQCLSSIKARRGGYIRGVQRLGALYAGMWRVSTPFMKAQLVLSVIGPIAAGVLIASGNGVLGAAILVVLLLDNTVAWPLTRARRESQRARDRRARTD